MNILEKIVLEKEREVKKLKQEDINILEQKQIRSFSEIVKKASKMNIIAEIKRASPSKGAIQMEVDPVEQAKQYEALGASAISVLTDEAFFNGSIEDLRAVRDVVDLPILCKDFIIDKVQIDHAKAAGANIILLIVVALDHADLTDLYEYAIASNLEVLVEVHNEDEMERALNLNAKIIGINNRNLKTFEVDLENTEALASMVIDPDTILISESGIRTRDDVTYVESVGANCVLIGETFMRATDLPTTFTNLRIPLKKKEGR